MKAIAWILLSESAIVLLLYALAVLNLVVHLRELTEKVGLVVFLVVPIGVYQCSRLWQIDGQRTGIRISVVLALVICAWIALAAYRTQ